MIKAVKIKCPLCGEESQLYLSINPAVIILKCPDCWTPLMYTKTEIRILSEHELKTIAAPSAELEVLATAFIKQDSASPRNLYIYDGDDNKFWIGEILSGGRNVESCLRGVRTSNGAISTEVDGSVQSLQVRVSGYIYGRKQ